jgi:hypothetical protein
MLTSENAIISAFHNYLQKQEPRFTYYGLMTFPTEGEGEREWVANSYQTDILLQQEYIIYENFPDILKMLNYYFENKQIKFYQLGTIPIKMDDKKKIQYAICIRIAIRE